jgi:hypothetical protein
MARSTDPKKVTLWQRRFQRYLESGLSVARFCSVEDVSESSFYYWHKKLGPLRRRPPARAEDRDACFEGRGLFQPVTVVPAASGVVVRLPDGTQIEVPAGQLDAIRAVVAETVSVHASKAATESSSANGRGHHEPNGVSSC